MNLLRELTCWSGVATCSSDAFRWSSHPVGTNVWILWNLHNTVSPTITVMILSVKGKSAFVHLLVYRFASGVLLCPLLVDQVYHHC